MADATVRGNVGISTRAQINASLTCRNSAPSGSINGRITTMNANCRQTSFDFRSTRPIRIAARRSGNIRNVDATFGQVTLVNRSNGNVTRNARLALSARRGANMNRSASLTITRAGGGTLRTAGNLRNGRVAVSRNVSCQLLLR